MRLCSAASASTGRAISFARIQARVRSCDRRKHMRRALHIAVRCVTCVVPDPSRGALLFRTSSLVARASQRSDVECSAGLGNEPLNWSDTAVGQLQAIYIVKSCGTIEHSLGPIAPTAFAGVFVPIGRWRASGKGWKGRIRNEICLPKEATL